MCTASKPNSSGMICTPSVNQSIHQLPARINPINDSKEPTDLVTGYQMRFEAGHGKNVAIHTVKPEWCSKVTTINT